jgi:hypothetical protein
VTPSSWRPGTRSRQAAAIATAATLGTLLVGCGSPDRQPSVHTIALPRSYIPLPVGRGPRFRPPPRNPAIAPAGRIGPMSCAGEWSGRYGVHLELFAHRRVVTIPAGIGIAPPVSRSGARVLGGRCSYALRTREPTGVFEVAPGRRWTLRDLFAVWGKHLAPGRLLSFRGRLRAFVDGHLRRGDPRTIELRRHVRIALEITGAVPPHSSYRFPNGL